uniref:Uncharacterized protein n=1 Tax=Rhizophora mucronata TaxID=61149 RepID=A0A2P2IZU7_RHIMU
MAIIFLAAMAFEEVRARKNNVCCCLLLLLLSNLRSHIDGCQGQSFRF